MILRCIIDSIMGQNSSIVFWPDRGILEIIPCRFSTLVFGKQGLGCTIL
jgi:hypothetical protein